MIKKIIISDGCGNKKISLTVENPDAEKAGIYVGEEIGIATVKDAICVGFLDSIPYFFFDEGKGGKIIGYPFAGDDNFSPYLRELLPQIRRNDPRKALAVLRKKCNRNHWLIEVE